MEYKYDHRTGSRTGDYDARRYKVVACKVMMREMYLLAQRSRNIIDIIWLKQALHDTPDALRKTVQETIDAIEDEQENYDGILLGYGLCSNGIVGLTCRKTPLVIPRAHDCITLFLGSKEEYRRIFDSTKGIYWYTPGWIEHSVMPGRQRVELLRAHYTREYGEDNADYLMEMEQGWLKEYQNAVYIEWRDVPRPDCVEYTQKAAEYLEWQFGKVEGSPSLMCDMLEGDWDESRFLTLSPGQSVAASFDESIISIQSEPAEK